MNLEIYCTVIFCLFGLMIGSFMNALIYRLPREINISVPRSSCPHCKKMIYWYENIPVISYVLLAGRCSGCKRKISIRYPLIEIMMGIVSVALAPSALNSAEIIHYLFSFSVFAAFFVHIVIDLEFKILPDGVNIYLAAIFFLFSVLNYSWQHWLLGGLFGFSFPYLITWIFYKIKGEVGLGGGDIKLYAAVGIYLGPFGIMQNIFLSCFIGSVITLILMGAGKVKRDTQIPFGPFIIIAAMFQIFFPVQFTNLARLLFI